MQKTGYKNQKFHYSESDILYEKSWGVAAFFGVGGAFQFVSIHWNLNLRFGRLVLEKTKKKSKISLKYSPQTFSKAVDKMVKQKRPKTLQALKGVVSLSLYTLFFENR